MEPMATIPAIPAIDPDRAIELLRAEVAKVGAGYKYDGPHRLQSVDGAEYCVYEANGAGCCIVGRALISAGVPATAFADVECLGIAVAAELLAEAGVVSISDEAANVLQVAQEIQDEGLTWGRALDAAEAEWAGATSS